YFSYYLPPIVSICLYGAMFAFGYLTRKDYRYLYAKYFMISALFPIIASILFFVLNRPFFIPTLYYLNIPAIIINMIVLFLNLLFLILDLTSAIFLFLAFYSLYKTHITQRTQPDIA
ncbi:MAG: hypothetical protein ACW98D_18510, partial [Promethearchaeota archaeon]